MVQSGKNFYLPWVKLGSFPFKSVGTIGSRAAFPLAF